MEGSSRSGVEAAEEDTGRDGKENSDAAADSEEDNLEGEGSIVG